MLVLGCSVRLINDVLDMRSNPHAVFLVLLLFPSLVNGEQDWVTLLASIPATMLVWLLATVFTFQRRGLGDRPALLLTPSRGLGGGIERYMETVEWAFAERGVEYRRVDLQHPGPAAHARMLSEAREQLRAITAPARLVVAHRSLLPVAWLLARSGDARGISVICHGNDVWGTRGLVRANVEDRLMRRPGVRIVAVSNFTAGALAGDCRGVGPAAGPVPGMVRHARQGVRRYPGAGRGDAPGHRVHAGTVAGQGAS